MGKTDFVPPAFVPGEAWDAFVDMRKAKGKRAPFTEKARDRMILRLGELDAQGHDIEAALWQSVRNGWSDVYPPKDAKPKPTNKPGSRADFWARSTGRGDGVIDV